MKTGTFRHPWFIWSLATSLLVLSQLSADIYLPSMPAMSAAFAVSKGAIQFASIIAMISFGLSLFVWGPVSDHWGRRAAALWGTGIFVGGSFICMMTHSIEMLWVGRALQGFGIGCSGAITPVIPKDIFSGAQLIRAFAAVSMVMGFVPIVAQVIGGYLQEHQGWRECFVLLWLVGVGVFIAIAFGLPETNRHLKQHVLSWRVLGQHYWAVLADKAFFGYVLCMSLVYAGEVAYSIVTPFVLQEQLGLTPVQNGWLAIFTGGGLLTGALLSSIWSRWWSIHGLMQWGLGFLAASTLMMGAVVLGHWVFVWTVVGPMTLFMVGAGLIYPNCIAGIMVRFDSKNGVAGALMGGLQMIGAGAFNGIVAKWQIATLGPLAELLLGLVILSCVVYWRARRESNPWPRPSEGRALSI